jgi:ketosteroid isomerase-like protein
MLECCAVKDCQLLKTLLHFLQFAQQGARAFSPAMFQRQAEQRIISRMNRTSVLCVLALFSLTVTTALADTTTPRDCEVAGYNVQQVLAADEARRVAMLHNDIKTLDSLLAEDVTIVWGDGTKDNKTSTLALFRSGKLHYSQLEYDNTCVRVYGDSAIVTGDARVQAESADPPPKHSIRYLVRTTRVYVHKAGRWRMVAGQTTRVAPISQ